MDGLSALLSDHPMLALALVALVVVGVLRAMLRIAWSVLVVVTVVLIAFVLLGTVR